MTAASLNSYTAKDLAQMARERGVAGWHSMRKDELIRALSAAIRRRDSAATHGRKSAVGANGTAQRQLRADAESQHGAAVKPIANGRKNAHSAAIQEKLLRIRDLTSHQNCIASKTPARLDRLVVMVRDPYWLHAYWELAARSVERARAALGQRWHGAQPVLRLLRVKDGSTLIHERDIVIHGGVRNWYIDVPNPPATYRLEIGYAGEDGSFYRLARSNEVSTPRAGTSDAVDANWQAVAENADRIFAMSGGYSPQGASRELQELLEQRLGRPLGSPMKTRYGSGVAGLRDGERLEFAVDAEIIVYGVANRDAHVTLQGEPVRLREDGSFAVRLSMPDKRQVIPIIASSHDGVEQRTTILAVERNTKQLEPLVRDRVEQTQ